MRRFAPSQADLFAPSSPDPLTRGADSPDEPWPDPMSELTELLASLRAARHLPWPDAAAAMSEERRALGLARLAGPEGERLVAAILVETERLLSAAEDASQY